MHEADRFVLINMCGLFAFLMLRLSEKRVCPATEEEMMKAEENEEVVSLLQEIVIETNTHKEKKQPYKRPGTPAEPGGWSHVDPDDIIDDEFNFKKE